ncbi:MAG: YicC/YloC family endoribonuclease [Pseudomonadota bacterium]
MQSMTGFAAEAGETDGFAWAWEAKSVNGRGLELRFRVADGFEGAEQRLRAVAAKRLSRGNVTINLRVERAGAVGALALNEAGLEAAIAAAGRAEALADAAGLTLAPSTAAQLLNVRGILEPRSGGDVSDEVTKAAEAGFAALIDSLAASREAEGARVKETFARIVDEIERLTVAATEAHAAQEGGARERIREKVAALLETEAEVAPDRLAQELALIAVKADVSEELERLATHVAAARDLLAAKGPVGRKLDFLTQEFNREANTLCSKSGSAALTQIGLDLKVAIDQMREQAQNVE